MPCTRALHIGKLYYRNELIHTVNSGYRNKCVQELNSTLFDLLRVNAHQIEQLPPLDDWQRSTECDNMWEVTLPSSKVVVSLATEMVEFP